MINLENITLRETFKDLQVGDVFFTVGGGFHAIWNRNVITRLTDKMFYRGYGKVLPNGRHEYEDAYRREDGRRVGGHRSEPSATLPTKELINRLAAEQVAAKVRSDIRSFVDETRTLQSLTDEVPTPPAFTHP